MTQLNKQCGSGKTARGELGPLVLLLCLTVVFFARSLLTSDLSVGSDALQCFYPWREFPWNAIRQGQLPLWNPFAFMGIPFQANVQSALFYPLNLIYLALPTAIAYNYSTAGHVFLAGLFTYLFGRRLGLQKFQAIVPAVGYMFSGLIAGRVFAGHLAIIQAMAWIPGLFLVVDWALAKATARRVAIAGVGMGLSLLLGFPQLTLMTMLAVLLYVLFLLLKKDGMAHRGRMLAAFVAMVVGGILLAAVQIIPAVEFTVLSVRSNGGDFSVTAYDSLPPQFLTTLLAPDFFGNPVDNSYWGIIWGIWHEYLFYVGVVLLILAGLAIFHLRRNTAVLFFAFTAAIFLVLALGKYTPVYGLMSKYVPLFALFRVPARNLVVAAFALVMLSGFGVDILLSYKRLLVFRTCLTFGLVLSLVGILVGSIRQDQIVGALVALARRYHESGALKMPGFKSPDYYFEKLPAMYAAALHSLYLPAIIAALLAIFLLLKDRLPESWTRASLVGLILVDLWGFGLKFTYDPHDISKFGRSDTVQFLKKDTTPYRALVFQPEDLRKYESSSPSYLLLGNAGMALGIPFLSGEDPVTLERLAEFVEAVNGRDYEPRRWFGVIDLPLENIDSPLIPLTNLKYIITEEPLQSDKYTLVFDGDEKVYEAKTFLPRAYVVHRVRPARNKDEALQMLADRGIDFRLEVVLTTDKALPDLASSGRSISRSDSAEVIENGIDQMKLRAKLDNDGYLFLSDVYYPGWRAKVDGRETEILPADHLFRAVFLTAGEHDVEFVFDPMSFKLGLVVSLITLVVVGVVIWLNPGVRAAKSERL